MSEIETLELRLREIDQRRAQIDAILDREPADTYRRQELLTERNELMGLRSAADNRIRSLQMPAPAPDQRRQSFIDREVAVRRAETEAFIAKLEREGDHRQARLWRGELLKIREQVDREFSA